MKIAINNRNIIHEADKPSNLHIHPVVRFHANDLYYCVVCKSPLKYNPSICMTIEVVMELYSIHEIASIAEQIAFDNKIDMTGKAWEEAYRRVGAGQI